MKYYPRDLESTLRKAASAFPAIVLTGPRRAGKTTLLRHLFPRAQYLLLEEPDLLARVRADPQGFLEGIKPPVILDEIQNVPEIFGYVRTRIDRQPRRTGQWLLTGSHEMSLMQNVTESMAGRAAILQLLPMTYHESSKVSLLHGGYPEVLARPSAARLWFTSYLQTYLERDVRAITAVRDLSTYRRFLTMVATRHGQLLNKTELAAPLGISVPTITKWLSVLETTGQILIVPPYHQNFGKRLVKTAKIYVTDSGLACHLLGIDSASELEKSPFLGALFEGFVASEIVKRQVHRGEQRQLYYFRDEQGLEVDFVLPKKGGNLALIECKASRTVRPEMALPMQRLATAITAKHKTVSKVEMTLVYRPEKSDTTTALAPGVKALSWQAYVVT